PPTDDLDGVHRPPPDKLPGRPHPRADRSPEGQAQLVVHGGDAPRSRGGALPGPQAGQLMVRAERKPFRSGTVDDLTVDAFAAPGRRSRPPLARGLRPQGPLPPGTPPAAARG